MLLTVFLLVVFTFSHDIVSKMRNCYSKEKIFFFCQLYLIYILDGESDIILATFNSSNMSVVRLSSAVHLI